MANRIFDTLSKWMKLDDAALDDAIRADRRAATSTPKRRAQARRLFAAALETPGGLKVQTIHGFCTRLLQQFPFEANVAARFRVLDETQQNQILEDIRRDVLLEAARQPDSAARTRAGQRHSHRQRLHVPAICAERGDPRARQANRGLGRARRRPRCSDGAAFGRARHQAGRDARRGREPRSSTITPDRSRNGHPRRRLCRASSSKNDQDQGPRLTEALARERAELARRLYLDVFSPTRAIRADRIVTAGSGEDQPDLARRFADERPRHAVALRKARAV